MLGSIAYCSRMTRGLSEDAILEIARTSQRRNHELGVTGLLFCAADRFIQLLEGEAAVLSSLYERIRRDERHCEVVTVMDGPIAERSFADWSMRLVSDGDLSPTEQGIIALALQSVDRPGAMALA